MTDDSKKKTRTQGQPKKMQNQQKVEKGHQDKREVGDVPLLRFGVALSKVQGSIVDGCFNTVWRCRKTYLNRFVLCTTNAR
jgi:hypothetical protein